MRILLPLALVAALVLPGCYHAKIETGERPGTIQIDKPFALGFVYGIVPPPVVETMERCPAGVAVVETKLSIVNAIVSSLTFGIVTPMHITVTCAADGMSALPSDADAITVAETADTDDVVASFSDAADRAAKSGDAVYVRFE